MIRFATQYAKTEILIFSMSVISDVVIAVILGVLVTPIVGVLIACFLLPVSMFFLLFFRDPVRRADKETISISDFLSPADGVVTDISEIEDERLGKRTKKIGIFMSVFDVHINRSPCYGKVIEIIHQAGEFLDARKPESSIRNERNDIIIEPKYDPVHKLPERIIVRQIAGMLAKRIVCELKAGDEIRAGQRIGMIKFGSRVELIVPIDEEEISPRIKVQIGQKVYAGDTILLTY